MKHGAGQPPRMAEWLLEAVVPPLERTEIREDLRELFGYRLSTTGAPAAKLWYWRQVLSFAWRLAGRRRIVGRTRLRERVFSMTQDIVYAGRTLIRTPGFTLAVLVTLALGVGANAAIYSVVSHIVLRPLGHPDESRLLQIWPEHRFTREAFDIYRSRTESFESISAFASYQFTLTGGTSPEVVRGLLVSPEHFPGFARRPVLGRDFAMFDSFPGSERVAIVSYELWQNKLGGNDDVLGERIELSGFEGGEHTVVGVAPPRFRPFGKVVDVWTVLEINPDDEDEYSHIANLGIVGRLKPGVDVDTARAELETIARGITPIPSYIDKVKGYRLAPLREVLVEGIEPTLFSLLGAVALVLLLCCFNVANLLLARGPGREREMLVRLALGASRTRIARQLATENLVLATAGSLSGLALAWLSSPFLARLVPPGVPRADAIAVDFQVVVFALLLALVTSLVFGWVPVLRLSRGASGLKSRSSAATRERSRLNRTLVGAEIALSLVLVVASGLLVKSFWRLQQVETGFAADGVVSMKLLPSTLRYADEENLHQYYDRVLEALRTAPGVVSAGAIQILPMTSPFMAVGYSPTGAPVPAGVEPPSVSYRIVTPEYRGTLGIPLLRGRDLTDDDRRGTEKVGLVNDSFAREVWPSQDPVGKQVRFDDGNAWFTVVGVVADVHQHRLDRLPQGEVYVPYAQDSWPSAMSVVVRTMGDLDASIPVLREAIWEVDSDVPIRDIRPMREVVWESMTEARVRTLVFSGFAALAFLLSAVGVYGVISYTVSERTRDIGIRMALGATARRVLTEVLSSGMRPVVAGILLGTLVSLLATRLLTSFLFQVEPTDASVFLLVAVSLSTVAALSAYLPARRASRVDPSRSLNVEA
ncbi:MAG TPA: ADOP family duplicated permease [Vicinamibacteria bacterium]|nr:ADOP family duplicated permease [Vicinamibacteria bacterium]